MLIIVLNALLRMRVSADKMGRVSVRIVPPMMNKIKSTIKVSIIFFDVNFLYYRCGGAFLKKLKCFLMTKGMTSTNQQTIQTQNGYEETDQI